MAGERIALTQPNLAGLTVCDAGHARCEPLAVPIDDANRFDWVLAGDAMWYRGRRTPGELVRYDLTRGATQLAQRLRADRARPVASPCARTGRALLVAREAPPAIDLMYAPRAAR